MKPTLLLLLGVLGFQYAFGQKQTNFWYFGTHAGLDFTTGSPVLTIGSHDFAEGTASIADSAGNYLFVTDGVTVWNKLHVLMPNGTGLKGDISTTQVMIVPDPGNSNLFYIFHIDAEAGPDGLNYSVVDMRLDGGNGDVTTKNVFLRADMTEKVCAVHHCNGHDIWVLTHDANSAVFAAYLVTDNGVSAPILSTVGGVHTDPHGQMKFTTDGSRIASGIGDGTLELFDFDNRTGVVSNPVSLPAGGLMYGLEFSPDNSKLYYAIYEIGNDSKVLQIDLNASDIPGSKVGLDTIYDPIIFRGMQLGPDGKIYVVQGPSQFLAVINNPNATGVACNFVANAINVDPNFEGIASIGLVVPGFIQSYFHPDFPFEECLDIEADFTINMIDTAVHVGDCISFTEASGCAINNWQWTFAGADSTTSTVQNPTGICYRTPGAFYVQLIGSNGCMEDTVTKTVTVTSEECKVAIPDAFTPNDDGTNERALVLSDCIETMHFIIFNRWGQKVFEAFDQQTTWDGTYKGELQPISTFSYYFEGTLTNSDKVVRKGCISLIR